MSRRIILGVFSPCLLVPTFGLGQTASAQKACKDACWIDVKSGKRVPTAPLAGVNTSLDGMADAGVGVTLLVRADEVIE